MLTKIVNGETIVCTAEEEAAINAEWTENATTIAATAWYYQRQIAYPPLADLADALVHQQMGDDGVALTTYLNKCIAVKTQFPKGQEPSVSQSVTPVQ